MGHLKRVLERGQFFLQAPFALFIERALYRHKLRKATEPGAKRRLPLSGLSLRAHQRCGERGFLGAALIKARGRTLALQHRKLLANGLAQAQALMLGKTTEQALAEQAPTASATLDRAVLARHRTFPGNRPSTTLLLEALTPPGAPGGGPSPYREAAAPHL